MITTTRLAKKLARLLPLRYRELTAHQVVDLGRFVTPPAGFHGLNPSVVPLGDEFLVCLRCVNYVLSGPDMARPVFTFGDRYMTVNRFFVLDAEFQLVRTLPALDSVFDDVEDIKLFTLRGRIMGVGSCADPTLGPTSRAIGLLTLDADLGGGVCRVLSSPFGFRYEKNWAPFVADGELRFIYSFDPAVILRCDPDTGQLSPADAGSASVASDGFKFLVGGSSAGIPVPGGFLFAAHRRRISLPSRHRVYLSRLYHFGGRSPSLRGGRYFSIGPAAIQFINGVCVTPSHLVVTYGQDDRHGYICKVPKSELASILPRGVAGP